jgi:aldose 1-epimerase
MAVRLRFTSAPHRAARERWHDGAGLVALQSTDGLRIAVTDAGAAWASCRVPMPGGEREVLLGYQTAVDYLTQPGYLGAIVGRYANRIAGASFALDGRHFALQPNEGEHQLHGGAGGFHRKQWDVVSHTSDSLELALRSPMAIRASRVS